MGVIKYNGKSYSGLIQANGYFIDTDDVIQATVTITGVTTVTYTASQDCVVCITGVSDNEKAVEAKIDNVRVWRSYNASGGIQSNSTNLFLAKGQVISISNGSTQYNGNYTVYGLVRGSLYNKGIEDCNISGVFINTDRIIARANFTTDTSYTATEDCAVKYSIAISSNTTGSILINGEYVESLYTASSIMQSTGIVYVKKGQTVTFKPTYASSQSNYVVYGLLQGTNGIFAPVIYSDNERCIGVWRDNKPLYQKTFYRHGDISSNSSISFADVSSLSIETLVSAHGTAYESGWGWCEFPEIDMRLKYDEVSEYMKLDTETIAFVDADAYVTIQYTKTTDNAGSGDWTTDGTPTHHYSTSEQVIGTHTNGKPIYEKTWEFTEITLTTDSWVSVSGVSVPNIDEPIQAICRSARYIMTDVVVDMVDSPISVLSSMSSNRGKLSSVTLQYTKTTD